RTRAAPAEIAVYIKIARASQLKRKGGIAVNEGVVPDHPVPSIGLRLYQIVSNPNKDIVLE
ncbi:MAG: hypothetical protein ACR2PH_02950, partial [Desulfobulbia bacterium]